MSDDNRTSEEKTLDGLWTQFLDEADNAESLAAEGDDYTARELKNLGECAQYLRHILERVEKLKKDMGRKIASIEEELVPAAMDAAGVTSFKLDDGTEVGIEDQVFARLKNPEEALQWLRDTGNDGIIRDQLIVDGGKDADPDAFVEMIDTAMEYGLSPERKQTVHPSTLRAFVRECLKAADGDNELSRTFPREAFGVHEKRRVKIKQPKE